MDERDRRERGGERKRYQGEKERDETERRVDEPATVAGYNAVQLARAGHPNKMIINRASTAHPPARAFRRFWLSRRVFPDMVTS